MEEERNSKRRYNREYRSRTTAKPSGRIAEETIQNQHHNHNQQPQPSIGTKSPKMSDSNKLKVYDNQAGADKISRDSGVISPSDNGVDDTDSSEEAHEAHENISNVANNTLKVHDNPTAVPNTIHTSNNNYLAPVKAEIVTNELDNVDEEVAKARPASVHQQPPPYHIAATRSKQASNFYNIHHSHQTSNQTNHQSNQEEHFYENQVNIVAFEIDHFLLCHYFSGDHEETSSSCSTSRTESQFLE